jgi:dUTP pyrophosphatase
MNNILAFYNNLRNNNNNNNNSNVALRRFAVLRLAIDPTDNILVSKYQHHAHAHNQEMLSNPFPNAGFDLFIPDTVKFDETVYSKFVDLKVKAEMIYCDLDLNSLTSLERHQYCGYLIHPRSSISKTPLMLANHTGIIDSGYRGSLIGAFRWLPTGDSPSYTVDPYTRLLQICHPSLCPILVEIVDASQLAVTERGAGGFGSTGV